MSRDGTTTKRDETKLKQMSEDETKTKYQETKLARKDNAAVKRNVKRRHCKEME